LNELSNYLEDDRCHVVAAPGSGKTVLGLEVIRRLNQPTLILAPTIAIRNQWIQRLLELFLGSPEKTPSWISKDCKNPKFLTVSTYQGLHVAVSGEEDDPLEAEYEDEESVPIGIHGDSRDPQPDDIFSKLVHAGIKTIVLDEAHHLRSAWWKTLKEVIDALEDVQIVALTATPPYDVTEMEWTRYSSLCGPADAEIPVPELVEEGNLCPHQDYIMFSTPAGKEKEHIKEFRKGVSKLVENLKSNATFIDCISSHPWIAKSECNLERILDSPAYFSSIVVFLKDRGLEIPTKTVEIVAGSPEHIPLLSLEWIEILLEGFLFAELEGYEQPPITNDIERQLRRMGCIRGHQVHLRNIERIDRVLRRSISKLSSIKRIVELEYMSMKSELRMVILTDYIRKSLLPTEAGDLQPIEQLGVVPIFESIRRESMPGIRLGVLSGSIVIIPSKSKALLEAAAKNCSIDRENISLQPLKHDSSFLEVDLSSSQRSRAVRLITELFSSGGINVLVGTKALLGEGWDAPSINSLVMASFIGSYMLSNQMRGRAIRTQPGKPEKTANIWHLVCVEPDSEVPGDDYETMEHRFQAFLGVSFSEPVIKNGLSRLNIGEPPFSESELERNNETMRMMAVQRNAMRESWEMALGRGQEGVQLVQDIKASKRSLPRGFIFRNTIEAIVYEGFIATAYFLANYFDALGRMGGVDSLEILYWMIMFGLIITGLILLPKLLKALWLLVKYGPVKSSMLKIGETVLASLYEIGAIQTSPIESRLVVEDAGEGAVYCHLEDAPSREKSVFLEALAEVLNPILNPRYLIIRTSFLKERLKRKDYHAVPDILGTNRECAEAFLNIWKKKVGRAKLVYTRNRNGRIELLHARNKSLSATFRPKAERVSRWK
jgi:superfamily II DNA or RNA helicase